MSDIEKGSFPEGSYETEAVLHQNKDNAYNDIHEDYPRDGILGKFDAANRKLERKLGIETRGIERVPESARTDTRLWGNTFIWLGANCVLPTFALGALGPLIWYMSLGDSMITILFFNMFPAMIPAFMATFGPKLGLRQMTSARFSWGWYGAKVVAALNCIACVGWSTINTIAGAQTLVVIADHKFSAAVGVVIIALGTLVVGFFGYKVVHKTEQYIWIPTAVAFLVMLGVAAKHFVSLPMGVGQTEAAVVLSFGATIFGYTIGWASLSSDYNVYMPADASSKKIFGWTYLGLIIPLVLIMWLGAAVGSAALVITDWADAYASDEIGGLVGAVLIPSIGRGGKFFMFILVISVIANNIINVYSMGMSISVVAKWLAAIPRLFWPFFITAIYIPLAIVGAHSFSTALQNFLNVLGYWLAIYVTIVLEEHFIFRKGDYANYNVAEAWNQRTMVPVGYAAVFAGCCGAAGAAVGMAQTWWIGPLGALAGGSYEYGCDIGFELSAGFAGLAYPPLRYLEKRYLRR
ncbi:hypothetical protein P7C73_g2403, partial [Tremellales sp. Uapishka_1]